MAAVNDEMITIRGCQRIAGSELDVFLSGRTNAAEIHVAMDNSDMAAWVVLNPVQLRLLGGFCLYLAEKMEAQDDA